MPTITVETVISLRMEKVWEYWTNPGHITMWNQASPDWHCPRAENNLEERGRFVIRMEARDSSAGFDFSGTYTKVDRYKEIDYTMDDGRKVIVNFGILGDDSTKIVETFEAESTNPIDQQKIGWQAILDSFKSYCEKTGVK